MPEHITTLPVAFYHSPQNTALSSTKVGTFLRSKELYYKRYVTGELPFEDTPSITLGKLVDEIVSQGSLDEFKRQYTVAVKKKDNAELFEAQKTMDPKYILTEDTYARAVAMSDKIFRSPFFDFYRKNGAQFQVPLFAVEQWKGADINYCGLLDVLTIVGDTAYIDDLKTTQSSALRSPKTWAWHCIDFGYLRQMAVYTALVMQAHPDVKNIVCRHFAISTAKSDLHKVKLFTIPQDLLTGPAVEFFDTAKAILEEKDFLDPLPTWEEAEELPDVSLLSDELTHLNTFEGFQD